MIRFNSNPLTGGPFNPLLMGVPMWVACSGGPDSMAAVSFLTNGPWRNHIHLAHFNHDTPHGQEAEAFVVRYAEANGLPVRVGHIDGPPRQPSESLEAYWSVQRHQFFNSLEGQVVTAHHLDDVAEWWIFSSLRGEGKLIGWNRKPNVVRPFLRTRKADLVSWCDRKGVPYLTDPSNIDTGAHMRNYIRHTLMPHALHVNPGLHTTLFKRLTASMQAG